MMLFDFFGAQKPQMPISITLSLYERQHLRDSLLCSTEKMTKRRVHDDKMFIIEWTVLHPKESEYAQVKYGPNNPAAVKSIGNFSQNLKPIEAVWGLAAGAGEETD